MIDVLVVDDQPLIRQAVSDILAAEDGINVVAQANNGAEAVRLAVTLQPDVVLMDIRMPEMDGITATSLICADSPSRTDPSAPADTASQPTRVLILTTFEEDEYVVSALRAGASGFIGKGSEPEDICRAVRAIAEGDALLSPAATRALISRHLSAAPAVQPKSTVELDHLTEREREVLLCVARGQSNQEIADNLFISPHTAKTHLNRIMAKLNAHDRAQLVIVGYETGLIAPGG